MIVKKIKIICLEKILKRGLILKYSEKIFGIFIKKP